MKKDNGQIAIIMILAMAVIGVIGVSVASRSVEGLKTQEVETGSTTAFKAAEAGLEKAILEKTANVSGSLPAGGGSYTATYSPEGSDGFVTPDVEEGDVVQIDLSGAAPTTMNSVNIYWNSSSAIFITDIHDVGSQMYYNYAYDPDTARASSNKFQTNVQQGNFVFKGEKFNTKQAISINLATNPKSKLLRILVLYANTSLGVEPIGGTFATGQVVTTKSIGQVGSVKGGIQQQRFSLRVPAIFDNVLYTNGSLSQ